MSEPRSDEPRELGTLVVVVGKARNLVNKSRFGKQDPFCTLALGESKHKTKSIKRGGQNPEWDEELRFKIMEDTEDVMARLGSVADNLDSSTSSVGGTKTDSPGVGVTTAQALASKSRKGPMNKKAGKNIRLAVYADDAKEPELIGESRVSIDDVLKKGEIDEWYDLQYKDKYSGEVYLELTFFSNDAPPVRRNVPRPSVVGHANTLSGPGLTHSGSVSGMSLYIPPYVKNAPSATATPAPAQTPAPATLPVSASVPSLPPSSSFANLGLPPVRQQNPLPAQPSYPPQPPQNAPRHSHTLSIDSLTRPMSSMSLSSSSSNLALPQHPQQVNGQQHGHRHSMSGEAPWGSLLAQAQPRQSNAPLPRPMSSNDAVPWEQAQRLADQRQQGGATPVPRPSSGIDYRGSTPIPPTHAPVPPVQHHANSFSGPSSIPGQYPTPVPDVPHSNSAPPVPTNQYNHGQASFHGIIATLSEQARPSSTAPPQHYGQQPDQYGAPSGYQQTPPHQEYAAQPQYGTPTRQQSYPYPASQQAPLPTPPQDPYAQQGYQQAPAQQQYQDNQHSQSAPVGQPAPAAAGGYVPWYQQTQPQQPQPAAEAALPGSYPTSAYPASGPPPVPSHRPVPNPPAPPKTGAGYYPSDELYLQQQQPQQPQQAYQPHVSPLVSPAPWQQQQNGYPQQPYGQQPQHSQPYVPPQTPVQAPVQAPWQQAQPQQPQYGYQPSSTPVPQSHTPQLYQPDPNARQPSPAPPQPYTQHAQQPLQPYDRQPSPAPIQQQPPSSHAQQVAASYAPPLNHTAPTGWQSTIPQAAQGYPQDPQQQPRQAYYTTSSQPYAHSASPQPPSSYPPQPLQPSHSQSNLPSTPQHSLVPPGIHGASPAAPRSPSPAPSPHGTPSGQSNAAGKGRPDWKSYMQSLSVGTSPAGAPVINGRPVSPARSPSPQPPPKEWYTPPPSVPSSIGKPPGWQSSVPQDSSGHQWRA